MGLPIEIAAGAKDATGLALLSLTREIWIIKDRLMITEALLQRQGLLGEIDSFQPDEDLAAALAAERDRFITAITTILSTGAPAD